MQCFLPREGVFIRRWRSTTIRSGTTYCPLSLLDTSAGGCSSRRSQAASARRAWAGRSVRWGTCTRRTWGESITLFRDTSTAFASSRRRRRRRRISRCSSPPGRRLFAQITWAYSGVVTHSNRERHPQRNLACSESASSSIFPVPWKW